MDELLPTIESILSNAWDGAVKLAFGQLLEDRGHVARLDVLVSPAGSPKTIILKRWRSEDAIGFDPSFFDSALLNEWASLEFLAGMFSDAALAPQLYGGDAGKGFFVMADLLEGHTLHKILQGTNTVQAEQALLRSGAALGMLHGKTLGKSATFEAFRRKLGHPQVERPPEPLGYLPATLKAVEELNVAVRPDAYDDVEQIADNLSQVDGFYVLHHGDPIPSNTWVDHEGGIYLIDFESAHFDHALLEGVNARMGFPTCGMAFVNRVPEAVWRQAEAAYRAELVKYCSQAADDKVYRSVMTAACALWLLGFCGNWLEAALIGDFPPHKLNRIRQCAIFRMQAFVQATQEFDSFHALGETFTKLLVKLRAAWSPDAQELPLYPVFEKSTSV
ncbi:MAG: phosphotransferase [Anaerolineae bacterium]|nr:phosphotransferase [Anaerolineae bacterium]